MVVPPSRAAADAAAARRARAAGFDNFRAAEGAATAADSGGAPGDPDAGLGAQVCKTGGPLPFVADGSKKNVVIMGDSVSIGYAPFVGTALADVALTQHSPWGGDGGAEETEYGWRCLEYLLRAPDGTPQVPLATQPLQ